MSQNKDTYFKFQDLMPLHFSNKGNIKPVSSSKLCEGKINGERDIS